MNYSFDELKKILVSTELPNYEFLFNLVDEYSTVLEEEITDYRPADINGEPGSLIDFQEEKIPVIVVPDLHARHEFLLNLLCTEIDFEGEKISVYKALEQKKVRIICVGDALHSERDSRMRWYAIEKEMEAGTILGPAMNAEMVEGLSTLCAIMYLKIAFPQSFHFLKGNHENILNKTGNGDFSFRKYADEGHMVMEFLQTYYGDDILFLIHCAEKSLPLVAVCRKCVISHAEPKNVYTKKQIINARFDSKIVEGLTWTDNNEASEGSVNGIIKELAKDKNGSDFVYFGGHRPVENNYALRQNGTFIQIHNPLKQNIAFVDGKEKFNPEKNIFEVKKYE